MRSWEIQTETVSTESEAKTLCLELADRLGVVATYTIGSTIVVEWMELVELPTPTQTA